MGKWTRSVLLRSTGYVHIRRLLFFRISVRLSLGIEHYTSKTNIIFSIISNIKDFLNGSLSLPLSKSTKPWSPPRLTESKVCQGANSQIK